MNSSLLCKALKLLTIKEMFNANSLKQVLAILAKLATSIAVPGETSGANKAKCPTLNRRGNDIMKNENLTPLGVLVSFIVYKSSFV
jgi:hypothetical protein